MLVIGAGACLAHNPPSRDVNPLGSTESANVYAPTGGEVWLVDSNYLDDNNRGYGRLVVLRIPVMNLPSNVRTTVSDKTGQEGGYIYIAYAHLSTIHVTAAQPIPESLLVGVSGSTGGDPNDVHLDITVIWDDEGNISPSRYGGANNSSAWVTLATNVSEVNAVKLDPLDIWPELGPEPSCCPDSCN